MSMGVFQTGGMTTDSNPIQPNAAARIVELVVVAHDRSHDLEHEIRRLHLHLIDSIGAPDSSGWRVVIADNGSTDGTALVASALANELAGVSAVQFDGVQDRKQLRRAWSASEAAVSAFIRLRPGTDLDATLAPLFARPTGQSRSTSSGSSAVVTSEISRRRALLGLGTFGLSTFLAACGVRATTTSPASSSASTVTTIGAAPPETAVGTTAAAVACVLSPELTEGPYYLDLDMVRSDIVEDREGALLGLELVVVNADTCAPIADAAVDIWHCDAEGLYSGFVAESEAANGGGGQGANDETVFLRGTQISDAAGKVRFETIIPGWYRGRTVHIHVKVNVGGSEIHTGQLFFDDSVMDDVFAVIAPYAGRGDRDTRNSNDRIYSEDGGVSQLVIARSGAGYAATHTMGIRS
jgi:protocatechuate 3,4-dioxygenase beta subunit